jgi:monoamine oxidase
LCCKSKWPYRQDDHGDESMNTANVPERVDVVVVGGGMAGLSAARDLLAANVSVLVLEARNRVGGRLLNHTLGNGSVVELGGQWVGPTQDRVLALAEELGLGLFPTYVEGEHFLAMDGSVKRYVGEDFALPESVLADLEETWEHLRKMADEIPLEGPWLAAKADTWEHRGPLQISTPPQVHSTRLQGHSTAKVRRSSLRRAD